jgi:hypothetical protein
MQKLRLPHCSRRIRGANCQGPERYFYATSPRYPMSMDQIGQKQKAKRANRVKASAGARIGTTRRANDLWSLRVIAASAEFAVDNDDGQMSA